MVNNLENVTDIIASPKDKQEVRVLPRPKAEFEIGSRIVPARGKESISSQNPVVLIREDLKVAFPIIDGVPVLLAPEVLHPPDCHIEVNLNDPKYEEAYEEMDFYNEVASEEARNIENSQAFRVIEPVWNACQENVQSFPTPRQIWLDSVYDCAAQWDAYKHISPIKGKRVLQMGGKGAHAVKFLLGGASEAWVVTPMIGEVRCAVALAEMVGVGDKLKCVVAVAEELPFVERSFDIVFSGGSLHHTRTERSITEVHRILRDNGRFAATDPWRAPLYSVGTAIFGKREPNVYCRPLTEERVKPVRKTFSSSSVEQHGTLTRYPLLALKKLGLSFSQDTVWKLNKMDDAVCSLIPRFREMGSSVACLGTK
ncbi:methyltransferase domain-containing protein [Salinibacter ruber]|uniref:methyltransferase domain-containing protein n=1 Tax=Salinibacter ruber TaxID=146919 RepID=UPI000E56893F|nr:methyltransferase domain-containing protein [Salinibacter ruber]